ncbi:MAG: hypothetical protein KKE20_04985 [Nanoarchaeota archaeon]|nr:hypothetical protein [Nanoarchaeota archaeon]
MFSKKGMIFTSPRDTISFVIGLILITFGIIPLLNKFGAITWNIPGINILPVGVLIWITAIAGFYILIDGFIEPPMHIFHWLLIIAGLIMMVIGLLPILHSFGVIGFKIPGMDNLVVYQVIITMEGLGLAIAGTTMH